MFILILCAILNIDSIIIGLSYGLKGIKIPIFPKLVICLCTTLYSILSITLGKYLSSFFAVEEAKSVGGLIIVILGIITLTQILFESRKRFKTINNKNNFIIKPFNTIIHILINPNTADCDNSLSIDFKEAILIGTALSIDSMIILLGISISGFGSWYIPVLSGAFQFISLSLGYLFKKA